MRERTARRVVLSLMNHSVSNGLASASDASASCAWGCGEPSAAREGRLDGFAHAQPSGVTGSEGMLKRMVCVMMAACAVVLSASAACAAPRAGACGPGWETGFALPGILGLVYTTVAWDDGTGPALYIGGSFEVAGNEFARNVVKWTASGGMRRSGRGVEGVHAEDGRLGRGVHECEAESCFGCCVRGMLARDRGRSGESIRVGRAPLKERAVRARAGRRAATGGH